ncbi:MAG TPA: hypothetical protein VLJ80_03740 [Solirubrobacteraceae bacterium]|nr:hypothetical protein [Solirubrobacteraceae bacterium]
MSSHESTAPETTGLEYEPDVDYEPDEQESEWLEDESELPRRPRRRLLTPIPLALLAVLLIACGFIGGVLVQKGQGGTASPGGGASGFPSLSALKGSLPAGAPAGTSSSGGSGAKGGASTFPGIAGGGGVTTGEVAYVRGNTLYVTDSQGNTVKVSAAAGAKVTKTVGTKASSIHPGATVVVLGSKAKNGSISASSISVSSAASGSATSAGPSSSGAGSSSGGTPSLFGSG